MAPLLSPTPASSPTGLSRSGLKRHRRVLVDNLKGISNPTIRRLARRGGVKRISLNIYPVVRTVIKERLKEILRKVTVVVAHPGVSGDRNRSTRHERSTVTVKDVIFVLQGMGNPVFGFGTVATPDIGAYNAVGEEIEAARKRSPKKW